MENWNGHIYLSMNHCINKLLEVCSGISRSFGPLEKYELSTTGIIKTIIQSSKPTATIWATDGYLGSIIITHKLERDVMWGIQECFLRGIYARTMKEVNKSRCCAGNKFCDWTQGNFPVLIIWSLQLLAVKKFNFMRGNNTRIWPKELSWSWQTTNHF